jgi:serine/threonine protein kinase
MTNGPLTVGPANAPDRFTLVKRLGGGGMGMVYEACDRLTGERVAIKTLPPGDSRFLINLQREYELVHDVVHPNVVQLHELFEGIDRWFLSMELVDGRNYLDWVRAEQERGILGQVAPRSTTSPPFDVEVSEVSPPLAGGPVLDRVQQTLPQLGSALLALHARGLVHGDVKPSNVMVTAAGKVVLIDFGLICNALEEPHGRAYAGTPAYMAPEQVDDVGVTPAVDCYAVGVMLYQALTGRLPFVGTRQDLFHHKKTWVPVAPSLLAPGTPAALETLCLRLLAPDPQARPTTMELARW